ncbi:MAG: methylmalonyl Co-A mutase-associated GTPase MeaB, partial [Deltaproteobacteria bacterium]|nr:methylmalonyl Co-A mutase-associated GTPase MeaB [Deltaproteobacteria bacterium]
MTEPTLAELGEGVLRGDRRALAKAITLVESSRPDHQERAQLLLEQLLPHTGRALRVGITGVPGVGKSTFIEAFGMHLVEQGHRVAVLAVDPSSTVSGGSILGDKTRMERLSASEQAFIRPSPSRGALGGVAAHTREAMLLCEAAGHGVVLVETVGVGQSEYVVASMVDTFLVLMLPGAGDELQGIKRGILELADALLINKADGEGVVAADRARADYRAALALFRGGEPWVPPVLTVSSREGRGMAETWDVVRRHRTALEEGGGLASKRRAQWTRWFWALLEEGLRARLLARPSVAARVA